MICVLFNQAVAYFAKSTANDILNFLALYTIIVQWLSFIHAGGFFGNEITEKYYDLTGSLTFLTTLALSLYNVNERLSLRQIILSSFTAIWSIRLGWFLFKRIHDNNGIDSRFTVIKLSRPRFMMTWTLQGLWVFITAVPVLLINQSNDKVTFNVLDYIGISFWVTGFFIEIIADYQKLNWGTSALNKSKFIYTGLWTISRHPNYFGEIILWIGIALSAFSGSSSYKSYITFLSPALVAFLLIFVSGIKLLEKKADQKYGKDSGFNSFYWTFR